MTEIAEKTGFTRGQVASCLRLWNPELWDKLGRPATRGGANGVTKQLPASAVPPATAPASANGVTADQVVEQIAAKLIGYRDQVKALQADLGEKNMRIAELNVEIARLRGDLKKQQSGQRPVGNLLRAMRD